MAQDENEFSKNVNKFLKQIVGKKGKPIYLGQILSYTKIDDKLFSYQIDEIIKAIARKDYIEVKKVKINGRDTTSFRLISPSVSA
jgi:hypothetical protein